MRDAALLMAALLYVLALLVPTRFPTRTVVLMVLALASFVWFWWRTHA